MKINKDYILRNIADDHILVPTGQITLKEHDILL